MRECRPVPGSACSGPPEARSACILVRARRSDVRCALLRSTQGSTLGDPTRDGPLALRSRSRDLAHVSDRSSVSENAESTR